MPQVMDNMSSSTNQWWNDVRQNPLLMAWNVFAFLSVVIPLIVFWICHSRLEGGSQDNDNNQDNNGWTWWWQNNNNNDDNNNNNNSGDGEENRGWWYNLWFGNQEERRDEEGGTISGALVFVYLWTLVLFGFIVYHVHQYIAKQHNRSFWQGNEGDTRNMLAILVLFANLSFVACILVGSNIAGMDERVFEEGGFFGMFSSCMLITYALWTFLCSVYCGILYKPSEKEYDGSSDYQRQTDDNKHNKTWFGGSKKESPSRNKVDESSTSGWMPGWIPGEKEETTGTGIKVKTADDSTNASLAPFECFGGSEKEKGKGGTMA